MVKGSVFYYYLNSAKDIFDVIIYKFWPSSLVGKEVENSLYRYYRILQGGMMAVYFNGLFFSIAFILTPLVKGGRKTPYKTVYPFDYSGSPEFEVMYLVQSFTNFYVVLGVIIGVDTLFMAICCNVTAQYRLLKNVFLKLGTDEVKELNVRLDLLYVGPSKLEENLNEEKKFLNRCISHHQLLLRWLKSFYCLFSF